MITTTLLLFIRQKIIKNHVLSHIEKQSQYYSSFNPSAQHDHQHVDDSDEEDDLDLQLDNSDTHDLEFAFGMLDADWKVPTIVTGDCQIV